MFIIQYLHHLKINKTVSILRRKVAFTVPEVQRLAFGAEHFNHCTLFLCFNYYFYATHYTHTLSLSLSLHDNGWTASLLAKRAGIAAPGDKMCGNKSFMRGPVWVLCAGTSLGPVCRDQSQHSLGPAACRRAHQPRSRHG